MPPFDFVPASTAPVLVMCPLLCATFLPQTYPPAQGNSLWDGQQVISKPDVESCALRRDDFFLILACDGIWDVSTNEQAVAYVRRRLTAHRDVQRAAMELVKKVRAFSREKGRQIGWVYRLVGPCSESSIVLSLMKVSWLAGRFPDRFDVRDVCARCVISPMFKQLKVAEAEGDNHTSYAPAVFSLGSIPACETVGRADVAGQLQLRHHLPQSGRPFLGSTIMKHRRSLLTFIRESADRLCMFCADEKSRLPRYIRCSEIVCSGCGVRMNGNLGTTILRPQNAAEDQPAVGLWLSTPYMGCFGEGFTSRTQKNEVSVMDQADKLPVVIFIA